MFFIINIGFNSWKYLKKISQDWEMLHLEIINADTTFPIYSHRASLFIGKTVHRYGVPTLLWFFIIYKWGWDWGCVRHVSTVRGRKKTASYDRKNPPNLYPITEWNERKNFIFYFREILLPTPSHPPPLLKLQSFVLIELRTVGVFEVQKIYLEFIWDKYFIVILDIYINRFRSGWV